MSVARTAPVTSAAAMTIAKLLAAKPAPGSWQSLACQSGNRGIDSVPDWAFLPMTDLSVDGHHEP